MDTADHRHPALITKCGFNNISALRIGMKNKRLIIIQVGNAKRDPAFQAVLQFKPVAGLEVHEEEIALGSEHVVDTIPIIKIIKRITGIAAGE